MLCMLGDNWVLPATDNRAKISITNNRTRWNTQKLATCLLQKGSSSAISGERIGIFLQPMFTSQPKLLRSVAVIQQSTYLSLSMQLIPFTSFVPLTHLKINKYLCDLSDVALTEPEGKRERWLCSSMGKNVWRCLSSSSLQRMLHELEPQ